MKDTGRSTRDSGRGKESQHRQSCGRGDREGSAGNVEQVVVTGRGGASGKKAAADHDGRLRSMTGFGVSEGVMLGRRVVVEVRSVNGRFLDTRIRLPEGLFIVEPRIIALLGGHFRRGRVDLSVRLGETVDPREAESQIAIDMGAVKVLKGTLEDMAARLGIAGEVDLAMLGQYRDLFLQGGAAFVDASEAWEQLRPVVDSAATACRAEQAREGEGLVQKLQSLLSECGQLVDRLDSLRGGLMETARARFAERILQIAQHVAPAPVDPARVTMEAAVWAERSDITEEMTRLGVHLEEFGRMLQEPVPGPVGRKMDFLLQELLRETNTSGSKVGDAVATGLIVELKSVLERMREQVQNLE